MCITSLTPALSQMLILCIQTNNKYKPVYLKWTIFNEKWLLKLIWEKNNTVCKLPVCYLSQTKIISFGCLVNEQFDTGFLTQCGAAKAGHVKKLQIKVQTPPGVKLFLSQLIITDTVFSLVH